MRLDEIILTERFINLFYDDPKKDQYKDEVYDILTRSYAPIGGLKGSGTGSPDELKSIPFWKLAVKDGKVVAAILYKDKQGRKSVALGTDGSMTAKRAIKDIVKDEPSRSYAEKSKNSLAFFLKSRPDAREFLVPFDQAKKISKDDIIPYSDQELNRLNLTDDERKSTEFTIQKFPFLKDFGYFRNINGHYHFKVMVGTPGLSITR